MSDANDIEEQLQRYRPIHPPGDLRARVVESARSQDTRTGAIVSWVPAFAAAAAAVMFSVLASNARADVYRRAASSDRDASVAALTDVLGGDALAHVEAARLIIEADSAAQVAAQNEARVSDTTDGVH